MNSPADSSLSSTVQNDVETLRSILDLEPLEINLFRGFNGKSNAKRVFGGQVVAQALVAARRTVEEEGSDISGVLPMRRSTYRRVS